MSNRGNIKVYDGGSMSTRKKLLISIIAVSVVLVIGIVTLIVTLVASSQLAGSGVTVNYEATGISAMVSARYFLGDEEVVLKNGEQAKVLFGPNSKGGTLKAENTTITLDETNSYVIFEYLFLNMSTSAGINISLNAPTGTNVSFAYSSSNTMQDIDALTTTSTTLSTISLPANATGTATKYVYIVASIDDITEDASCSGSFNWSLSRA